MDNIETKLLLGKPVSKFLENVYEKEIENLLIKDVVPGLAVILIGSNPSSKIYVNSKTKYFNKMKCFSKTFKLESTTSQDSVLDLIIKLNQDDRFHGILVQLPIPKHINESMIVNTIDPKKDVDGFHPINFGKLFQGKPDFVPCTPNGIIKIFDYYKIEIEGKHVVILGRSNIVGKPMFALLLQKFKKGNATVTICHTSTPDISTFTRNADIIIAAVGQPNMINKHMIKKGAILIDVGISRVDDESEKGYRVVGDIDFNSVNGVAQAVTPVPGGVGPMTITMLLINTIKSALDSINE